MEIKYLGHSSFLIRTKTGKVVTDPFDPKAVGLKYPKQEADIVTVSHHHPDHDYVSGVGPEPLVLDWPGEFEKNSIRIFGFQSYHDKEQGVKRGENILYKIESENISVLHCGDLGLIPEDSFIDKLGDVNVLLIPVGGLYTIDANEAVKVIQKIEPSIVIPMHYQTTGLNPQTFAQLTGVQEFLKQMGSDAQEIEKLTIKAEDFVEEKTQVIVLKNTA